MTANESDKILDKKDESKQPSHIEILRDIFSVKKDSLGNIKEAKATKVNIDLLNKADARNPLNIDDLELLIEDIRVTDPALTLLADIINQIMSSGKCLEAARVIEIATRIASELWINNHSGSLNLFKELLSSYSEENHSIKNLYTNITNQYNGRINSTKDTIKRLSIVHKESKTPALSEPQNIIELKIKLKIIEKQQESIFIIGAYWLLIKIKTNPNQDIEFLLDHLFKTDTSSLEPLEILNILISQVYKLDKKTSQPLRHLYNEECKLREANNHLQAKIKNLEQALETEKNLKQNYIKAIESHKDNTRELETSLINAQKTIEEQQLDQRTKRTHLKDNERNVKAIAYNLLTENVLEPLRLSLSALNRERPKVEIAIDKIKTTIEHIEGDLECFQD